MFWFLLISGALLESWADYLFKSGRGLVGYAVYSAGTLLWLFSLKYEGLAKAVSLFVCINVLVSVILGIVLLNETLTLPQWIGVGLSITAVVLLW